MSAPTLLEFTNMSERQNALSHARINGRLLLTSPLNGDDVNYYTAAFEMEEGSCWVIRVESGFVSHVWDITHRDGHRANEQAVAFTLMQNGWGEVLSGKWRIK